MRFVGQINAATDITVRSLASYRRKPSCKCLEKPAGMCLRLLKHAKTFVSIPLRYGTCLVVYVNPLPILNKARR